MSEVESLSDLPAWKAEKTVQNHGDNCHYRTDPRGTALHHYADLGERESADEFDRKVANELAQWPPGDTRGDD